MAEQRCQNCRFFQPMNVNHEDDGFCRRYPPVYLYDDDEGSFCAQPLILCTEWCGEWRPKAAQPTGEMPANGLSGRALNILTRLGVDPCVQGGPGDVAALTASLLRCQKNCGSNTVDEIRAWLRAQGLDLAETRNG